MNDRTNPAVTSRCTRRMEMAASVRRARGTRSQMTFAGALEIQQSTVSCLERGHQEVSFEMAYRIESVSGLPAGTLARWAGYVTDES